MATKSRRHRASASSSLIIRLLRRRHAFGVKRIHKTTRVPPWAFKLKVPYDIPYVFITSVEAPVRTPLSGFCGGTNASLPVSSPRLPHDFCPLFKVLHHSRPRCIPLPPLCLSDTHRNRPLTPLTTPTIMHHLQARRYVCFIMRGVFTDAALKAEV